MRSSCGGYAHAAHGAVLAVLLVGCGSGVSSPTAAPSAAPTSGATILPATPPPAARTIALSSLGASASAGPNMTPLPASGAVVSVVGTNEIHEKQTQNGGTETFDLVANFSASGAADNQMAGTSQLSGEYGVDSGCSWSTGPLSWTATLDGTYAEKPDGSLDLELLATPATSQTVVIDFGCGAVAAPGPFSIPWAGAYGLTLQNGVLDSSIYTAATAPSVGGETVTWHVEQASSN
jgi:hypothetical protein